MDKLRKMLEALFAEADGITVTATNDNEGQITEEQQARLDEIHVEIDALNAKIETLEKIEAQKAAYAAKQAAAPAASIVPGIEVPADGKPAENTGGATAVPAVEADPMAGWANGGEFLQAVWRHEMENVMDERLRMNAQQGLNRQVGSEGGFLVPVSVSNDIWDGLRQDPSTLVGRTFQIPSLTPVSIPANAETDRTTGNRFGGIRSAWLDEGGTIPKSNPTFRTVDLKHKQLVVLIPVTNNLLKSTTALVAYLRGGATDEIIFRVNDGIIDGTGAGQPLGLLNSGSLVTVAKESGQTLETIVFENISKMWARLHMRSRPNSVWYINQDIEPELDNLALNVGTGGLPVFLPANGLSDSPFGRLKGRPVIPIEQCKTLGTVGDIILADLSSYAWLTMPGGIEEAISTHIYFDRNESAFRYIMEADGQPFLQQALTPANGTNTLSTHVALATRA